MTQNSDAPDMVLVGAGIMSATLAVLLKELDPGLRLEIVEMHEAGATESSNPWNNAGTGHAGLCELNYTPQAADGSIEISKAVAINCQFEVSKQFWAYMASKEGFGDPSSFISPVPHISFVRGKDVPYLKKRHEALSAHHTFADMVYTEDKATIADWAPLMMPGRDPAEQVAATRCLRGTDVNFGALTHHLLDYLAAQPGVTISYNSKVSGLKRKNGQWLVTVKDVNTLSTRQLSAGFVFLGAGGGALPLLQMSGIEEGRGYGGFPVSGQWLRCDNPDVVNQHQAKVYSQAEVGAPPMSVPHLDTRVVDGKKSLLFGPYAGFTTKFLKYGSSLDLFCSIRPGNLKPMLAVARDNMDLTRYLIREVMQSMEDRLVSLRKFYPEAKAEDWRLEIAGQRVQIIKKDPKKGGVLQFGTELVSASDCSIAALLGASPGASVTVPVMLSLIERCFADRVSTEAWQTRLGEIFKAREKTLQTDAGAYRQVSEESARLLKLASA